MVKTKKWNPLRRFTTGVLAMAMVAGNIATTMPAVYAADGDGGGVTSSWSDTTYDGISLITSDSYSVGDSATVRVDSFESDVNGNEIASPNGGTVYYGCNDIDSTASIIARGYNRWMDGGVWKENRDDTYSVLTDSMVSGNSQHMAFTITLPKQTVTFGSGNTAVIDRPMTLTLMGAEAARFDIDNEGNVIDGLSSGTSMDKAILRVLGYDAEAEALLIGVATPEIKGKSGAAIYSMKTTEYGTIDVFKNVSEYGVSAKPSPAGVEFTAVNDADASISHVFVMTASGNSDGAWTEAPYGTYTIKETKTPDTLYAAADVTGVEISSSQKSRTVYITDKARVGKVRLELKSSDEDSTKNNTAYSLANAEFVLTNANGDSYKLTTNYQGIASVVGIPYGDYTMTQTKESAGFLPIPGTTKVTIAEKASSDEYNVVTLYAPTGYGNVTLEKVISSTVSNLNWLTNTHNYALGNSEYELTNSTTGTVYKCKTDINGYASLTNIPLGKYTLKETQAPANCKLNTDVINVTVTADDEKNKFKVTSEPIYDPVSVTLYETDAEGVAWGQGDAELAGSEYELKYYNEPNLTAADIASGSYTPDIVITGKTAMIENKSQLNFNRANKDACLVSFDSTIDGLTTIESMYDVDGNLVLPIGTVTLQETKPPVGYKLDGCKLEADVYYVDGEGAQHVTATLATSESVPYIVYNIQAMNSTTSTTHISAKNFSNIRKIPQKGTLKVQVMDDASNTSTPQGDATLAASFTIYNRSAREIIVDYEDGTHTTFPVNSVVMTLDTDETGLAQTPANALPYGTYEVVATGTTDSYSLSDWSQTFEVRNDGDVINLTTETNALKNAVKRGEVRVTEFLADFVNKAYSGDSSFANAEFTITNQSANAVYVDGQWFDNGDDCKVIKSNDYGIATTGANALPIGTYSIRQTKASNGCTVNTTWTKTFKITAGGQVLAFSEVKMTEENDVTDLQAVPVSPIRGGLYLDMADADRILNDKKGNETLAQGDASLAGAEFYIINRSAFNVSVGGTIYAPGQTCLVVTTDALGHAFTELDALPYGTYEVVQHSAPNGYLIDSDYASIIYVREAGVAVAASDYSRTDISINDSIIRSGLKITKVDADTLKATPQGNASFAGISYDITNVSESPVYVDGKWYEKDALICTLNMDENGVAQTASNYLPYGTYKVSENSSSMGYQSGDWSQTFAVRKNETVMDMASNAYAVPVQRGDIQIQVVDNELGTSESVGGAAGEATEVTPSLVGLTFGILNASAHSVYVDGHEYGVGEVVATIASHWNDELSAYTAETTDSMLPYGTYTIRNMSANDTYTVSSMTKTVIVNAADVTVTHDTNGDLTVFRNDVVRGDVKFIRVDSTSGARLSTLWTLKNNVTGEEHVVATDINGEFYSSSVDGNDHSSYTNANDVLLARIKNGETIEMSLANLNSGIWFGRGAAGTTSTAVTDSYGALPYGSYTLTEAKTDTNSGSALQSFNFYVYKNGATVDLGTILNGSGSIKSNATVDANTNMNIGIASNNARIVDTVEYNGLSVGENYKIVGSLVEKKTGAPIWYTSETGEPANVISTVNFTPEAASGTVDVEFIGNSEALAGKSVVVTEALYDASENKIAEYTSLTDDNTSIVYPAISSELYYIADSSKMHLNVMSPRESVVLTNDVTYTNLPVGKDYIISGNLFDLTTGDNVLDNDGNDVVVTKTFTPSSDKGVETMYVQFDASTLNGHTIVMMNTILLNGVAVASDNDTQDSKQTVHFIGFDSNVTFSSGLSDGMYSDIVELVNKLSYSNLDVSAQYDVVNKVYSSLNHELIYTYEESFMPDASIGTYNVDLSLPMTGVNNSDLYVVTTLSHNSSILCSVGDKTDNDVTVHFVSIDGALFGADGLNESKVSDSVTLTDRVSYTNLTVGQEYTVSGELYDVDSTAATGIVASTKFIPTESTGTVDLEFTFDATTYAGHVLSAETTVARNVNDTDVVIASQKDLTDEATCVNFPQITTQLVDGATGLSEVKAGQFATLVDTISYTNLQVGKTYVVSGQLLNKESQDEISTSSDMVIVPTSKNGTVEIRYEINTELLAGQSVVSFASVKRDEKEVASHADIDDANQTVNIPVISTQATVNGIGLNMASINGVTSIVDTVTYTNLTPGKSYSLQATLMNKESGSVVSQMNKNEDGSQNTVPITTVTSFVPDESNGTTTVTLPSFDATSFSAKDLVVYETLVDTSSEVVLAEHNDMNDENQTIHVVGLSSVATYGDTNTHDGEATEMAEIRDKIAYSNLVVGKEYTLSATARDTTTGEVLPSNISMTFTPTEATGTTTLILNVDASLLAGHTLSIKSVLSYGDIVLATNDDTKDNNLAINFPLISAELTAKDTGINEMSATADAQLVDTVTYSNLTVGQTYSAVVVLMDKETGKELVDANGKAIGGNTSFVAESSYGEVNVDVAFDASALAGKAIVAFAALSVDGRIVARFEYLSAGLSTITIPELKIVTTRFGTVDKSIYVSDASKIQDTVYLSNVVDGNEYVVRGTLYDAETGKELVDANGAAYTADTRFAYNAVEKASAKAKGIDISSMTSDAIAGLIVKHADDANFNSVVSTFFGKLGMDIDDETINTYKEMPGFENMLATLLDSYVKTDDQKSLLSEFVTTLNGDSSEDESTEETPVEELPTEPIIPEVDFDSDVAVNVVYELDTTNLVGKSIVSYETLYAITTDKTGTEVLVPIGAHEIANDTNAIITVATPVMKSTAYNKATSTSMMEYAESTIIVDNVSYDNLNPGTQYQVDGYLRHSVTGDVLTMNDTPITASAEFVPTTASGTVALEFTVDSTADILAGTSLVMYEALFVGDTNILNHENSGDDEDASVHVMGVDTVATGADKRSKSVDVDKSVDVVDTITYTNLVPGVEYYIDSTLAMVDDGMIVTQSNSSFTPEEASGSVDVTFTIDTTMLDGKTLVCYETITDNNKVVLGSHNDIDDEDQQVVVQTITAPQTAVQTYAGLAAKIGCGLLVLALAGFGFVEIRRRRLLKK